MGEPFMSNEFLFQCVCFDHYDLFWPISLWLFLLSFLMSDFGRNPLQRPIPPSPWELSGGLVLPSGHRHDTVPDPDIPFDPPIPPEPPPVPSVVGKQESPRTTVPAEATFSSEGDDGQGSNSENNQEKESLLSSKPVSKYWDKDLPFKRCTIKLHWFQSKLISDGSHPTLLCGW
jgi:hypothetical protein